jgi:hypothetical protein
MTQAISDAGISFGTQAAASQSFDVAASVAGNAMTLSLNPCVLSWRNPTLSNGTPVTLTIPSTLTCVIPNTATLGTVSATAARFVMVVFYNGGTPVMGVINIAGGAQLDGTNLVSPTTISAAATSASTFYSSSAVSANSPYVIVGLVDHTQTVAGTYASNPTMVQGVAGPALGSMQAIGFGQTWQNVVGSRVLGTTYYNTTGKPIEVSVTISFASGSSTTATVGGVVAAASGVHAATELDLLVFIVPPGASYVVATTGSDTVNRWAELR